MPGPTISTYERDKRDTNAKQNKQDASDAEAAKVASEEEVREKTIIEQMYDLLKKANLDSPETKKSIDEIHQNYKGEELNYFLSTLLLFFKKHVLTPETFSFMKSSMNFIEHAFKFVSSLFSTDLLNGFNLSKFFDLPILKSINAMFNVVSTKEEGELNQTSFDSIIKSAFPITQKFVDIINEDDHLKQISALLVNLSEKGFTSEAVLEAVKSHKAPQMMAQAIINLKEKGIELTEGMLNDLISNSDPVQLVSDTVDSIAKNGGEISGKLASELVDSLEEGSFLKTAASNLLDATKTIDTTPILEAVKANPVAKEMAEGVIDLKSKGVALTKEIADKVISTDNASELVASAVSSIGKGILDSIGNSVSAKAAQVAGSMASSMFSFFSSKPKASPKANVSEAKATSYPETPSKGPEDTSAQTKPPVFDGEFDSYDDEDNISVTL